VVAAVVVVAAVAVVVGWASLRTGDVSIELFDARTFWDLSLLRGAR
jgi:hypothetical protein